MKNLIIAILVLALIGLGYFYFQDSEDLSEQVGTSSPESVEERVAEDTFDVINDTADLVDDSENPEGAIAVSFEASSMNVSAGESIEFTGSIIVPENQSGNAIVFFGNGVSDLMFRKGPTLYEETWTHIYDEPGQYEVTLVLSGVTNADTEIGIMRDPEHPQNTTLKKLNIVVE